MSAKRHINKTIKANPEGHTGDDPNITNIPQVANPKKINILNAKRAKKSIQYPDVGSSTIDYTAPVSATSSAPKPRIDRLKVELRLTGGSYPPAKNAQIINIPGRQNSQLNNNLRPLNKESEPGGVYAIIRPGGVIEVTNSLRNELRISGNAVSPGKIPKVHRLILSDGCTLVNNSQNYLKMTETQGPDLSCQNQSLSIVTLTQGEKFPIVDLDHDRKHLTCLMETNQPKPSTSGAQHSID